MRAYDVERDVLDVERGERLTYVECVNIAAGLFAHFQVDPIPVVPARVDATRSWFRYPTVRRPRHGAASVVPARIHLQPGRGYNRVTVCHEVAHYVAYGRGVRGHDRTWAAIYVLAVEQVLGVEVAARLRAGFREAGLLRQGASS